MQTIYTYIDTLAYDYVTPEEIEATRAKLAEKGITELPIIRYVGGYAYEFVTGPLAGKKTTGRESTASMPPCVLIVDHRVETKLPPSSLEPNGTTLVDIDRLFVPYVLEDSVNARHGFDVWVANVAMNLKDKDIVRGW